MIILQVNSSIESIQQLFIIVLSTQLQIVASIEDPLDPTYESLIIIINRMEDSDQQGFHEAKIQLTILKLKNNYISSNQRHSIPQILLNRTPLALHHQIKLHQYPIELDNFNIPLLYDSPYSQNEKLFKEYSKNESSHSLLLSQYFPRKLTCVYNKFHQNLMLKRDLTIIIRNVTRRIRNDQLVTFQDIHKPTTTLHLSFTSDFEGGNLQCVYKSKKTAVYFLFLQNDINTHGYNLWFHFNVLANKAGKYKFMIVNMSRAIKCQDQKLLTFSSVSNSYQRKTAIKCFQSKFKHCEVLKNFYSLYFQYSFKEGQSIYISPTPPYTYSKVMRLIKSIYQTSFSKIEASLQIAGKSQIGNMIPCLKINKKQKANKKVILITARQHPCQTVGSFVCEQILKLLVSESDLAMQLIDHYTFYVIPMVNPDGVIHGNSRTNLLGYDINRSWDHVINYRSQQCSQIWSYLSKISDNQELQIYWAFDLHGHSKQLGYFAYFSEQNDDSLILNHILKEKSQLYDTKRCSFVLGSKKRQSLRGKYHEKFGIANSVTIQTSFYGYINQSEEFENFTTEHFKKIAAQVIEGLLQTHKILRNKPLRKEMIEQIIKNRKARKTQVQQADTDFLFESDSNPQEGYLNSSQRQQQNSNFKTLQPTKPQIETSINRRTITNFSSHLQPKNRRSLLAEDQTNKDIKSEQSVDSKNKLQIERISSNENEISKLRNTFHSPFRFMQRDSKPLKLRRKIYSEQKCNISSAVKEARTQKQQSLENVQEGLEFIRSKRLHQQGQKISGLGLKEHRNLTQKSMAFQTIVYPTSHQVVRYELSNKTKQLKQKIKALRQKQYGKKLQKSTFSQIFKSYYLK